MTTAYRQQNVVAVMKPHEKKQLQDVASAKDTTVSKLARVYITKGLANEAPPLTAQELVDGGMCVDIAAADKLLRLLKVRTDG